MAGHGLWAEATPSLPPLRNPMCCLGTPHLGLGVLERDDELRRVYAPWTIGANRASARLHIIAED